MVESELTVIPIIEESAEVKKRVIDRGGIRITKRVHEREEVIDETLHQERVAVERVPINQRVEQAPTVRRDGNTLIIPILEEVLVTEKRLMLKEELRVTIERTSRRQPQSVIVRREEAVIERIDATERKEK
jgi:stress response protein YsnF